MKKTLRIITIGTLFAFPCCCNHFSFAGSKSVDVNKKEQLSMTVKYNELG
jgi:hypothetical protein